MPARTLAVFLFVPSWPITPNSYPRRFQDSDLFDQQALALPDDMPKMAFSREAPKLERLAARLKKNKLYKWDPRWTITIEDVPFGKNRTAQKKVLSHPSGPRFVQDQILSDVGRIRDMAIDQEYGPRLIVKSPDAGRAQVYIGPRFEQLAGQIRRREAAKESADRMIETRYENRARRLGPGELNKRELGVLLLRGARLDPENPSSEALDELEADFKTFVDRQTSAAPNKAGDIIIPLDPKRPILLEGLDPEARYALSPQWVAGHGVTILAIQGEPSSITGIIAYDLTHYFGSDEKLAEKPHRLPIIGRADTQEEVQTEIKEYFQRKPLKQPNEAAKAAIMELIHAFVDLNQSDLEAVKAFKEKVRDFTNKKFLLNHDKEGIELPISKNKPIYFWGLKPKTPHELTAEWIDGPGLIFYFTTADKVLVYDVGWYRDQKPEMNSEPIDVYSEFRLRAREGGPTDLLFEARSRMNFLMRIRYLLLLDHNNPAAVQTEREHIETFHKERFQIYTDETGRVQLSPMHGHGLVLLQRMKNTPCVPVISLDSLPNRVAVLNVGHAAYGYDLSKYRQDVKQLGSTTTRVIRRDDTTAIPSIQAEAIAEKPSLESADRLAAFLNIPLIKSFALNEKRSAGRSAGIRKWLRNMIRSRQHREYASEIQWFLSLAGQPKRLFSLTLNFSDELLTRLEGLLDQGASKAIHDLRFDRAQQSA